MNDNEHNISMKSDEPMSVDFSNNQNWRDSILSIVAVLISLSALFISAWQTRIIKKHNELSVIPRLYISSDFSANEDEPGLYIENRGNGQATIINSDIKLEDKSLGQLSQENWSDMRSFSGLHLLGETTSLGIESSCIIPAGYKNGLIVLNTLKAHGDISKIEQILNQKLTIEITYKSIYSFCEKLVFTEGNSFWQSIDCQRIQ